MWGGGYSLILNVLPVMHEHLTVVVVVSGWMVMVVAPDKVTAAVNAMREPAVQGSVLEREDV